MPPVNRASDTALLRATVTAEDPGAAWDGFVAKHPFGHLMQSRAWAAARAETGWAPFFVSIEEPEAFRAAALCLRLRIPGTGLALLYVPRGPVVDWSDRPAVHALGEAVRQLAAAQRTFLVQADPPVPESRFDVHAALEGLGFRREEKHGEVLSVARPGPEDRAVVGRSLDAAVPRDLPGMAVASLLPLVCHPGGRGADARRRSRRGDPPPGHRRGVLRR